MRAAVDTDSMAEVSVVFVWTLHSDVLRVFTGVRYLPSSWLEVWLAEVYSACHLKHI